MGFMNASGAQRLVTRKDRLSLRCLFKEVFLSEEEINSPIFMRAFEFRVSEQVVVR
jgi:hypothetical protein